MQGNKGQRGTVFVGLHVKARWGNCVVTHQMAEEEYQASGRDYRRYFTLQDENGDLHECGRADFTIPRNKI